MAALESLMADFEQLKDRYRSHGFWALQVESFQMLISRRTSMDVFVCYANEAFKIALHCNVGRAQTKRWNSPYGQNATRFGPGTIGT
eukprot:COSAG03_NODE_220_length_10399_cov_58.299806_6_plen_87_part_00